MLERRDPLPPGRYWSHVAPGVDSAAFDTWLARARGEGVTVRVSERQADGWQWFQFDAAQPVRWGLPWYPNVVAQGEPVPASGRETVQRPSPPQSPLSGLPGSPLGGAIPWGWIALGAATGWLLKGWWES